MMSDLPITKNDYDRAALLCRFLSGFKHALEKRDDSSDVHYLPKPGGYNISFVQNGIAVSLSIKFRKKRSAGLKIKRFDNGVLCGTFLTDKFDINPEIFDSIFNSTSPKKTFRFLLSAFVSAVLLVAVCLIATAFSIVSFSHTDEARPADSAVVLGAAAPDGKVSPVYRERINHAVGLYESGFVKYIIMTGGTADGNTVSDALAAKNYAASQGVPENRILIEDKSTITEENLEYSKRIMDEYGLDSALIVSDPLHMKRAMLMADDYGLTAFSSPTRTSMYKSVKTKLPFLLREEFFYIGYRIVRIFRQ